VNDRVHDGGERRFREMLEEAGVEIDTNIDFATHMVVVIFMGRTVNCSGVTASFLEDDERILVRFRGKSYQSSGTGHGPEEPWGVFVIPRSTKPVVFYENTQGLIGYPPVWTMRTERQIGR
jgi:hypothetical protein